MGRRKKFGEESGFVNVRVPKSKVSEYREAIKKLVDEKFARESEESHKKGEGEKAPSHGEVKFRSFREYGKNRKEKSKITHAEEEDFIESVFREVEERRASKREKE